MNRLIVLVACLAMTAVAADPPKKPGKPVSKATACKVRFEAFCALMQRCSAGSEDLGGKKCEAIDPGCVGLKGNATYDRAALDACIAGLNKLTCESRVDPTQAARLEDSVAACAALGASDERPDAGKPGP
jgi:hypothetical protein